MRTRAALLTAVIATIAVVGLSAPVAAQQYTGRIDITVEDATGARLPGVTVELTGPLNQSAVTDARGEARFLNLTVGAYQLRATLAGFTEYQNTNVPVAAGVSVPLAIKLNVAGQQETIQVTAQSPVIDTKKQGTAVNVSIDELQNVPTARDPWVVMQSIPGIIVDRVNVGGAESGQMSGFMGKGSYSGDTTWNVDGMPITDMSSLSSPFYYDFDMFQEMSVTTGGADAKSATGGIQMNFMLKSGTNNFHGNARGYFQSEALQSTNLPDDLKYLGGATGEGDRTEQISDWGGDVGGPIFKDKWWFWAAFGNQDIRILKLAGARDRTLLKNISFKTQAQATDAMRASFTFFKANKQKYGRNAGATRPQETTWNQDGPNSLYKAEVNYVVGNNLFLVGRYAYVKGGFSFDPQGGMSTPAYLDDSGVWHDSYSNYVTDRPQQAFVVDANYFRGSHEIKAGFTWRKTEVHSTSEWPGNKIRSMHDGYPDMIAAVTSDWASDGSSKYLNFYLGDTITLSRATINAGVRFDRQIGSVLPSKEAGVSAYPLLPAITAPGVDNALVYNLLEPRVGFTYALDEARKTQLRATYAMFTSQIASGEAGLLSVSQYRYVYYLAVDKNGNKVADPGEIDTSQIIDYWGFDPANPAGSAESYNRVGDYGNPKTHEFIVGVDRELIPNFGVSASFTYRKLVDFNYWPYIGVKPSDFVQLGTLTGTLPSNVDGTKGGSYSVPYYGLGNAALVPPGKGREYQTREGYSQRYMGFEISAVKRMSDRWMARLGFSTNSWRENWDGVTPSGGSSPALQDPTHTLANPNINGGYVVVAAGGSGKSGIYMVQPQYQFIANGAYQAPYDIDLGISYIMREGYPMPWYQRTTRIADPLAGSTKNILLVPNFGQDRLPATATLDFRIGKTFKLRNANLIFDFDIFNLLNSATVLGRQYDASRTTGTTAYTNVLEIMQPRIARLGLRVTF